MKTKTCHVGNITTFYPIFRTTYAAGKAAADLAVYSYVNMFNLDAFIVRPFNNYGPRQNYKGYLAGIIPITAWRILNDSNPEIHGSGNQSRDFIYVLDTVDAIINIYPIMIKSESINISTDSQVTVNSLVEQIVKYLNYQGEIIRKPARVADVECHNASNKKIKSLIKYNLTNFEKGLATTLEWYKENI